MTTDDRETLRAAIARREQACATCSSFDPIEKALHSGVRYCRRFSVWRWPSNGSECRSYTLGEHHHEQKA